MANLVDKKCASTEWFTPPEILEPVRELFGGEIFYDPCTSANNPIGATTFCCIDIPEDSRFLQSANGLENGWWDKAFVNPPYGKQLYAWIEKTVVEAARGLRIVLLVSASSRWDQAKWQKIFSPGLTAMCMPRGRVKFLDANGVRHKSPPYPSLLFFYNLPVEEVAECFKEVGKVVGIHV